MEDIIATLSIRWRTDAALADLTAMQRRAETYANDAILDADLDRYLYRPLLRIAPHRLLDELYGRVFDASLRFHDLTDRGMDSRAERHATVAAIAVAIDRRDARPWPRSWVPTSAPSATTSAARSSPLPTP